MHKFVRVLDRYEYKGKRTKRPHHSKPCPQIHVNSQNKQGAQLSRSLDKGAHCARYNLHIYIFLFYLFIYLTRGRVGESETTSRVCIAFENSPRPRVFRWGYANIEKVLYCFYRIILKSTPVSKTSHRLCILSSKHSYRLMSARWAAQLFYKIG